MKLGLLASALMVGGTVLCKTVMASDLEPVHGPEAPGKAGTQVVDSVTGLRGYMVMLKADTSRIGPEAARDLVIETVTQTVGIDRMRYLYEHALTGFAAWMTEDEAAMLQQRPDVVVVEPDLYWSTTDSSRGFDTNPNEPDPWNLRRISAPDGLAPDYDPCGADGTGVTAIVIDTGIATDQTLFAGRIVEAISFVDSGPEDSNGHGTHVAGTIAGTGVGVAPACDIVSLSASGGLAGIYSSSIVAALNWVANPANASPPSVVNMSLGGPARGAASLIQFVAVLEVSLFKGIPVVVAASNESHPARWPIPANFMFAITVGATNIFDRPAGFSNYGPEVDIWAPGVGILSADFAKPDGGLAFSSGTSMSAPCASGVVALFLQRHVTPEQIAEEPEFIPSRAHIAIARAAVPALVDLEDPLLGAPGGTGTLGGSANQLLQACDGSPGVICDEGIQWHGNTASIILGDGVSPIAADFECSRTIWNAAGPVELTINTISIEWSDAVPLLIEDVATGEIYFDTQGLFDGELWDIFHAAHERTFVSSSRQGLRVIWQKQDELDLPGYGYVMTAHVRDNCAGDINGTGSVNVTDLLAVLDAWGPCDPSSPCMADLDGNGKVAVDDVLKVMEQWGPCAAYVPPGFIEDCNGNLVPKGFLGDGILDQGQREILFDPIFQPNNITAVDLDCPELNWDTLEGNPFVISLDDPRQGACALLDGSCVQLTLSQCQNGSRFWGAGVSCDSVQGFYSIDDPLCEQGDSQSYGLPMPVPEEYGSELLLPGKYSYRQLLAPGIYSISRLAWVQLRPSVMSKTQSNLDEDNASPIGLALSNETSFGITVYYTDGGEPDFVRRVPTLIPVAEYGSNMCSYVIEDLLPPSDREVHSIRIAVDPDGLQADSSWYFNSIMLSMPIAGGEAVPIAEETVDGGRTWSPVLNNESDNVQLTICVTP
ncbi:MAG: S8 family serine peptidase [Phycisphaerales bacterium]|nr:S8 family serine peptidase [Phycisphaerales bacterium]